MAVEHFKWKESTTGQERKVAKTSVVEWYTSARDKNGNTHTYIVLINGSVIEAEGSPEDLGLE
jgi:hypothetical protein